MRTSSAIFCIVIFIASIMYTFWDNILDLFEDETFDFIYVDGYAHTGENEGQTLHDWWPKLKRGGMFTGDDYHEDWPKVVYHVNEFCRIKELNINIYDYKYKDEIYSKYPSWYVFKN